MLTDVAVDDIAKCRHRGFVIHVDLNHHILELAVGLLGFRKSAILRSFINSSCSASNDGASENRGTALHLYGTGRL
jgi:hypothetical protein